MHVFEKAAKLSIVLLTFGIAILQVQPSIRTTKMATEVSFLKYCILSLIQCIKAPETKAPRAKILVACPTLPSFRSCYLFWKVQYLTSSTEAAEAALLDSGF